MRYYVIVSIIVALMSRDFYRHKEYTEAQRTMLGWAQLSAMKQESTCQCASGNVARVENEAFFIVDMEVTGTETLNVTVDSELQILSRQVSAVIELPGEKRTSREFTDREAYCVQVCFHRKTPLEHFIGYFTYLLMAE